MLTIAPLLVALAAPVPSTPPLPRISIDVKDAGVVDLVRLLADVGGFQVVADGGISCTLTLALKDVEWPTVLDVALRSCGLAQERSGSVVRVAPAAKLLSEAAEQRRLDEARAVARPLRTQVHRLSYGRAGELAPLLRKYLSPRGSVEFDARTNTLIVTDVAP